MRAVWYERKGPAREVLTLGEMPDPSPGPGEVRIAVRCSAVNPTDTKARGGSRGNLVMPFARIIPHQDGSGVIDAVGAGVPPSRVGERVWVYEAQLQRPFGTAAAFATVPAEKAIPLPAGVGFADGACLGVPALTAHRCVHADGSVAGQTVLVTGGAGAVGFYAIQFARHDGARVFATVSSEAQREIALRAGAHVAIDRHRESVTEVIRGHHGGRKRCVDRIVDVAFGANLAVSLELLQPRGIIASYASDAEPEPRIPFWPLLALDATVRFVLVYVMGREAHEAAVAKTTAGLKDGWLRHNVATVLPLENIAEAHEAVERRALNGKVVLEVAAGQED